MASFPRSNIEKSLLAKGFQKTNTDHRVYFFHYEGKKTSIRTKISHGSSYKVYGDQLVKMVQRQLRLDTNKEIEDFINCPMSEQIYIAKLLQKGALKP